MIRMLQQKAQGFNHSKQMESMPNWLKRIHKNHFENDAPDFLTFLELIKPLSKKEVKSLLDKQKAFGEKLTVESTIHFLSG